MHPELIFETIPTLQWQGHQQDENGQEKGEGELMIRRAQQPHSYSPWLNPQFLLQLFVIVLVTYGAVQIRTTTLQDAATSLKEQASKIESQVTTISASVQSLTTTAAELRANDAARGREIQELKEVTKMLEARIIVLEKDQARESARLGNSSSRH